MITTKKCLGCSARLPKSDPDVCELCDLHGWTPDVAPAYDPYPRDPFFAQYS